MADTYYFAIGALLPFDGSNGSTTFTDYAPLAKTWTAAGNAQLSTAQSKFGGSSLLLDGTGDWIQSTVALEAFTFGTGDFTVEFWLKTSDTNAVVIDRNSSNSASWQAKVSSSGKAQWNEQSSAPLTGSVTINDNAWHHVAFTRSSGVLRLFVDGTQDGSDTANTTDYSLQTTFIAIGAQASVRSSTFDYAGYIDDVRITRSMARYTANFTPPGALDTSTSAVVPSRISQPILLVATGWSTLTKAYKAAALFTKDTYHGGDGRIAGTVKEAGSPFDLAVRRRVRLYRKVDGLMIREQWSATDGAYSFDNIFRAQQYYVLSFDHTGNYNGVIKDSITPELMT